MNAFLQVSKVEDPLSWLLSFGCRYNPEQHRPLALLVWNGSYWYMIAKMIDLLDTIFFVLRKKSNQISFLHIYHHTITFTFSWYYLKYMPGKFFFLAKSPPGIAQFKYFTFTAESGVFIGLINSMVHVCMYTYYGLSALGPEYRKYLWWKRYITWIQLIQFFAIVVYLFASVTFGCNSDKILMTFFVANAFLFIYLFGKFYHKTYLKAVERRASEAAAARKASQAGDQLKAAQPVEQNDFETKKVN